MPAHCTGARAVWPGAAGRRGRSGRGCWDWLPGAGGLLAGTELSCGCGRAREDGACGTVCAALIWPGRRAGVAGSVWRRSGRGKLPCRMASRPGLLPALCGAAPLGGGITEVVADGCEESVPGVRTGVSSDPGRGARGWPDRVRRAEAAGPALPGRAGLAPGSGAAGAAPADGGAAACGQQACCAPQGGRGVAWLLVSCGPRRPAGRATARAWPVPAVSRWQARRLPGPPRAGSPGRDPGLVMGSCRRCGDLAW